LIYPDTIGWILIKCCVALIFMLQAVREELWDVVPLEIRTVIVRLLENYVHISPKFHVLFMKDFCHMNVLTLIQCVRVSRVPMLISHVVGILTISFVYKER